MVAPRPAEDPDADLAAMDRDALLAAARAMRRAIRSHRNASGHDLCWYHPELWALLPEAAGRMPEVPAWREFMQGCAAYRASLDRQGANQPRTGASFEEGERHDQV